MDNRFSASLETLRVRLSRRFHIPGSSRIEEIFRSFSMSGKLAVYGLLLLLVGSVVSILWQVNQNALVEVPAHGGVLTEGIVGSPRFANPLLAATDADRDLTELVYSGLMRPTANGTLIPDLADTYSISDDGLTYTFHLREDAVFQDGKPVTADDVIFTIQKAQDPALKSPRRANWDGVSVSKSDDHTVVFTLKQPYSPFLENTTMGILPAHIWQNVTDEQFPFSDVNVKPVGSGPFAVTSVKRDSSGIPTSYTLASFSKYALGEPYLSKLMLHFYPSETEALSAYKAGDVESVSGLAAADLSTVKSSSAMVEETTLPEVFGLFFNQNQQTLFTDASVRIALDEAIDRQQIVDTVFSGHAAPLSGPIPPGIIDAVGEAPTAGNPDAAAALLAKDGWVKNADGVLQKKTKKTTETLAFSISTANVPELRATAELMKETWEKLGVQVDVKIFEPGDLNQNVIRPRKYDALLFGEIVGRELDLYAFWHSSQRNDPGLNIAMYVNSKADKTLEDIRKTESVEARTRLYRQFDQTVSADVPAVFIYAPHFLYLVPKSLNGVQLGVITTPSERFLDAYRWYIESDRVWSFFTHL